MARIAGVNIPNQKRVPIALTYIHGIGRSKALDGVAWLRLGCMEQITRIAEFLRARNSIDAEIMVITGRPMTSGHLGADRGPGFRY